MGENKDLSEKIKNEKNWLHVKYISGISIAVSAATIVAACYTNTKFVDQVSFASSISSIILSVIAIIMTIIGESKSDNTKDTLLNLSRELEIIVDNVKLSTDKLEKAAINKDDIDEMQHTIIENVTDLWRANNSIQNVTNTDKVDYLSVFKKFAERFTEVNKGYEAYLFGVFYYMITVLTYAEDKTKINNYASVLNLAGLNDKGFLDIIWYNLSAFSPAINAFNQDSDLVDYITNTISEKYPEIKKIIDLNYSK